MDSRIVCCSAALLAGILGGLPQAAAAPPARSGPAPRLSVAFLEEHLYAADAEQIVVAQVRDEPITLRDVAAALQGSHTGGKHGAGAGEAGKEAAPRLGKVDFAPLVDRMIDARLITREARDMGMDTVPEFQKGVEDFKLTAAQDVLRARATAEVKVDPAEIERLYRESTREWKIRSVLVTQKADAEKLVAALKAGQSFDALVKQLVDEKKARGGEPAEFLPRARLFAPVEATLQGLKQGQYSAPVQVPGGFAVVKYEDVRYPDNAKALADAEALAVGRKKREVLEAYYAALIKRYVKIDEKLLDALDFEAKEPGFAKLKQDTRALATIEGAKPVTVGELAATLEEGFFHGAQRAADEKKINRQKMSTFDAMLSKRVVPLEIARQKITEQPEFKVKVSDYVNGALFSRFLELVVVPKLKLDEPAARKYYEAHKKDYTYPAFYTLESLVFGSVKEAQAALTKLQARTDFKWLNANAEGQIKGANRKLDINGTLSARGIPAELATLLANAQRGDFRLYPGPEGQYHVIHVVEVTPSKVQPFEEARAAVEEKLFPEQLNLGVKAWAKKLRQAHPVKVFLEKAR